MSPDDWPDEFGPYLEEAKRDPEFLAAYERAKARVVMPALTVRQPWAWAIAMGHKPIENRGWTRSYRGPLAIHAASRWDDNAPSALRSIVSIMRRLGLTYPRNLAEDEPYSGLGQVIAVAELDGICTAALHGIDCDCGPWAEPGQAHWQLSGVRRLVEPFDAKGSLGLWDVELPADVAFLPAA